MISEKGISIEESRRYEFTQEDMAAVLKLLGPYLGQYRQLQAEATRVSQVMRSVADAYLAGKGMEGTLALDPASGTLRYEPGVIQS